MSNRLIFCPVSSIPVSSIPRQILLFFGTLIRAYKSIVIIIYLTATYSPSWADISLFNGNYYFNEVDISYPLGLNQRIERTYNSKKNTFKGMFGWGWGSQYDVLLRAEIDGTVLIQEYGSGSQNR